jgi:hypothetical protein
MLFRNSNIENIPVIKKLCDNIMDDFKKTTTRDECNTLRYFVYDYIHRMSNIEKDNIMKSFNIIELDYYNRGILDKINNKYDGEPLVIICYDILEALDAC